MAEHRHRSGSASPSDGAQPERRRVQSRTARMSGAGPEAAVELFCEIADDIRLMLREVKQTNELLAGIADELRKGRRSVADGQAEVAHGRERLLEAIQSGDENTNRIIGSVESLIDELRRNR